MKNAAESIRKSIIKRQEAIDKFHAKRREFLAAKEGITKEIAEARIIWETALKQLPNLPFS